MFFKFFPDSQVENDLQEAIDTDLNRTFPDNVYFQNESGEDKKNTLKNVLVAFGRRNPEVLYCQVSFFLLRKAVAPSVQDQMRSPFNKSQ